MSGDTAGAKAAQAAQVADSADDYWDSDAVKGALRISTQLAVQILYEGLKLDDAIHHRGADRYADQNEIDAIRSAIQQRKDRAKSEGFWMDAEPDGGIYVSLEQAAHRAGHDWESSGPPERKRLHRQLRDRLVLRSVVGSVLSHVGRPEGLGGDQEVRGMSVFDSIKHGFEKAGDSINHAAGEAGAKFATAGERIADEAKHDIKSVEKAAMSVFDDIKKELSKVGNAIKSDFQKVGDAIHHTLGVAFDEAKKQVDQIPAEVATQAAAARGALLKISGELKADLAKAGAAIKGELTKDVRIARNKATKAWEHLDDEGHEALYKLQTVPGLALEELEKAVETVVSQTVNGFLKTWPVILGTFETLVPDETTINVCGIDCYINQIDKKIDKIRDWVAHKPNFGKRDTIFDLIKLITPHRLGFLQEGQLVAVFVTASEAKASLGLYWDVGDEKLDKLNSLITKFKKMLRDFGA